MSVISTTFEVYPTTLVIPTLVELLKVANQKLRFFLKEYEIQDVPLINVRIEETIITPSELSTFNTQWNAEYAWFYVQPSEGGGTDAYYHKVDQLTLDIWDDYGDAGDTYLEVKKSLSVGYYWSFRRSAGQPAIINLAYGFIASALAELTEGYLFSDDGAWHGRPMRSKDFDTQYFVPNMANSFGKASWYERCLEDIINEYKGKLFELQYQFLEENKLSYKQRLVYYPSGKLFREGPEAKDRLFVMLSLYGKLPYLFIDRTLISTTEELLVLELRLIDVKEGYRISTHSIKRVLEVCNGIDLDGHDISFWANPLSIENEEGIKKKITG